MICCVYSSSSACVSGGWGRGKCGSTPLLPWDRPIQPPGRPTHRPFALPEGAAVGYHGWLVSVGGVGGGERIRSVGGAQGMARNSPPAPAPTPSTSAEARERPSNPIHAPGGRSARCGRLRWCALVLASRSVCVGGPRGGQGGVGCAAAVSAWGAWVRPRPPQPSAKCNQGRSPGSRACRGGCGALLGSVGSWGWGGVAGGSCESPSVAGWHATAAPSPRYVAPCTSSVTQKGKQRPLTCLQGLPAASGGVVRVCGVVWEGCGGRLGKWIDCDVGLGHTVTRLGES